MNKQHILDEIKRTAVENGGRPLGQGRFQKETGVKQYDWSGKYWSRWGDALKEAGFSPNAFGVSYSEDFLLEKLCVLIRELGHFPVKGERALKRNQDKSFPSNQCFYRLGNKHTIVNKIIVFCQQRHWEDVIRLCPAEVTSGTQDDEQPVANSEEIGFVYLIKSGKYYKIGHTNAIGRREYEIGLQLPEKTRLIHSINTDDPVGIETYWHSRFEQKRANGEWFDLTSKDVNAFRRRKFM